MQKINSLEKILLTEDILEIEQLIYLTYCDLKSDGCNQGLACKIFLTVFRHTKFKEYFLLWIEKKKIDKTQEEFKFLRVMLEFAGMGFYFMQLPLNTDHKKTLVKGLYFESLELGIDIQKVCFECFEILATKETIHNFGIRIDASMKQDFYTILQHYSMAYTRILTLNISQRNALSSLLKKIKHGMDEGKVKISTIFGRLFNTIMKIEGNINNAERVFSEDGMKKKVSLIFTEEKVLRQLLLLVIGGIHDPKEHLGTQSNFFAFLDNMVLEKIKTIGLDSQVTIDTLKNSLGLYNVGGLGIEYFSYIDKVLLITIKWISVIQNINGSINNEWKIRTFLRESYEWVNGLEAIINLYDNDDWEIFEKLLEEENSFVEWKSSLLTSIESKMPDGNFKKINLQKISETIISMMNTDGGNIVIGYIENVDKILKEQTSCVFKKGKHHFYDIRKELEKNNYKIDKLYRDIEDLISQELKIEITDFCDNITINEIDIYDSTAERKTILQISILKSERTYFSRGENSSILVRKRMGRRNEYSDPLKEFI